MAHIRINKRLSIPRSELEFQASRSGGPGGQHANTTASRVQLRWNVDDSPSLSDRRRQLIRARLDNRIDSQGILQITVDTHRSQHRNRDEAVERFAALVREALQPRKIRKKTRPTLGSRERRLEKKKRRGRKKELRKKIRPPKEY
jgi:ribosome-associated protein